MITGRNIIFTSSIDWDDQWQAPQELAVRLSQAGNRVLYIENTGVRSPGFRDTKRIVRRLKHWAGALHQHSLRQVAPNIWVHAPLVLPPFGSGIRESLNRHLFLPLIGKVARGLRMTDPIIWTFLPTDTTLGVLDLLSSTNSRVIYYCAGDFAQLTTDSQQLARNEAQLVRRSYVVFTICEELATHCRQWNNNVHVFPYGVNLKAFPVQDSDFPSLRSAHGEFSWARQSPAKSPAPAAKNGHKVIGYVGGWHRHVSVDMLTVMARARPTWSWVFVGSSEISLNDFADLPNVYILGQRPHRELADYIRTFDVCIVPYKRSTYTETVVPSKINEYLAMGKPIVSTNLPWVCAFNEQHQVIVTSQEHPEEFLRGIEHALSLRDDDALIARRRAVARQGDWETRLESMSELITNHRDKPDNWGSLPALVSTEQNNDHGAFSSRIVGPFASQPYSHQGALD
ncbi:MAG TPA: glycosyltransferase [Pyrinomonadaceae bacterium]|nr:glycosyltransferase [Pyrinomonadaceae bacterium]